MSKPRLLDLFCGAGGAGRGYELAGFEVVGVDIAPQPHYPYEFIQSDALAFLAANWRVFDAFHASPPCQAYSDLNNVRKKEYSQMIEPTRIALMRTGRPYAIENVDNAPLQNSIKLCGTMFGLRVQRHRLFECNPPLFFAPYSCCHYAPVARAGRPVDPDKEFISVVGHFSNLEYARVAMGIDWMNQKELAQAIPPAYTEFVGSHLIGAIALAEV